MAHRVHGAPSSPVTSRRPPIVIEASANRPASAEAAMVHEIVGAPIVSWREVAFVSDGENAHPDDELVAIDQVLQVGFDLAVEVELAPTVEAVAMGLVMTANHPPRAIIVGVGEMSVARRRAIGASRMHRATTGRCLGCEQLAAGPAQSNRLVYDGTCFGAFIADGGNADERVVARVVPWAHVSTLAALTEVERLDLSRAIRAVVVGNHSSVAFRRLWFHQAPAGDDSGDVHLFGEWRDGRRHEDQSVRNNSYL